MTWLTDLLGAVLGSPWVYLAIFGAHWSWAPRAPPGRPADAVLQAVDGYADTRARRTPTGLMTVGVQLGVRGATRYLRTRLRSDT